jgi:hypothetical protein
MAMSVPSTCHRRSHRCTALLDAHWGPRGRSHQRQPVISTQSKVLTTLRKDVSGTALPRPYKLS